MAQATVPALPAQAIFTPQNGPSAPNGNSDPQAFAKALDQRRHGVSSTSAPATPPKKPGASSAQAADTPAPPENATAAQATATDTLPPQSDVIQKAAPRVTDDITTLTDAGTPADPREDEATAPTANDDGLQASLAGLPAALAALLAGNGAAPAATPAQGLTENKRAAPQNLPLATAPAAADLSPPELLAEGAQTEAPEGFAAELAQTRGTDARSPVRAAVLTETGPASRAAETAQLAAATTAGDAAAPPATRDANPGAGLPWNPVQGSPSHRADATTLRLQVTQPPDHPAWAEAVGNRVTWMVGQKESTAELVLTPPQLGRIEVSLSVNGDHTTAQFVAATPAAREALEQAMPRLREVLANAGMTLTDSGVSTSHQGSAQGESNRQNSRSQEASVPLGVDSASRSTAWLQRGQGLVDTFA